MSTTTQIEKMQQTVRQIIKSVTHADNFGACLYGPPGLGKSTLIRKTLADLKTEYKDIPLHSSPIAAAKFIADNAKGTLLYDDVADSKHPTHIAIQKALFAPDPMTGQRVIRINTSKAVMKREGIPPEIIFEGKIIFVMNAEELGDDVHSSAMQSRIPYFKYDLSFEERLWLIKEMSQTPGRYHISQSQMDDLMRFIESSAHSGVSNFDLRLLGKAAAIIRSSPEDWHLGVRSLIDADPRFRTLKQIIAACDEFNAPISDRIRLFTKATGQSRSTYFNLCRKFGFTNPTTFDESDLVGVVPLQKKPKRGRPPKNKSNSPGNLPDIDIVPPSQGDSHGVEVVREN